MDFSKTSKITLMFVFLSYLFSVLMRYVWIYQMQGDPSIMWNNQFLILSPDGYTYAEGARDILSGVQHNINSRMTAPLSILTAFLVKILPFSFETVIFYMSTFLSSLIVIPVFYIAKRFGSNYLAFGAAIYSSIVVSYYTRTMSGYYDTDMLIIVLPMFMSWFLIEAISSKNRLFALLSVIATFLFAWWLPSDIALNLSIAGMLLIYTLLFERNILFNYFLFILVLIAALPFSIMVKLPVLAIIFIALCFNKKFNKKIGFIFLVALFIALIIVGVIYNELIFNLISQKLTYYFTKASNIDDGLYFGNSGSHVLEVSNINYREFATRVSGQMFIFPVALIGYFLMTLRHHIMIIFLPMLLFGFMSYGIPGLIPSAGLRFSFYATPILAISLMYMIVLLSASSKRILHKKRYLRYILFILVMIPNINYVINYKVKSILRNSDIQVLDKLKKTISRDDYIISWWDYGYYLQYYSDANTVCDGGWQLGKILYPVSVLFMSGSQDLSSRLAHMISYEARKNQGLNYTYMMMKTYGYTDPSLFFDALESKKIIPKKNKFNTYIYIPSKMIGLYSVIDQFYRTDLKTGKVKKSKKYFYLSPKAVDFKNKDIVMLGQGIAYIKNKQELYFRQNNNFYKVKKILTITYQSNGNMSYNITRTGYSEGYIMIKKADGKVLIVDDIVFNSTLIQMGVLGNYNPNLYEAIELFPEAKVYRVKE